MTANEITLIIGATVTALVTLGAGFKWAIGGFLSALKENTKAVTDASTTMAKAVSDASAAQVAASNELRLEVRELRVEVRTIIGLQPPSGDSESEDGELPPLAPVRGPALDAPIALRRRS